MARKRELGHTEYRDRQKYELSAHEWPTVRNSRVEGMGKVGLVPPR